MILLALAAAAMQTDRPRAFIQRIYAGYSNKNYDPLAHLDRIFAPRLTAAIREDTRLAHGEVGYLDGDPLCDCQDYERLRADIFSLKSPVRTSAIADVHLDYGTGETRVLQLRLVLTRWGWRVADIGSSDEPSLLSALETANRKARAAHH